jgi:anti-anti-sigma factor
MTEVGRPDQTAPYVAGKVLGPVGGNTSSPTMRIHSVVDDKHITVTVRGNIDVGTVNRLQSELFRIIALGRPAVVDLTDTSVIDPQGVALLVAAHQRATACGTSTQAA